jgi:pyruvate/2-oxoacid:ferredoxin oxidoreductase alpha subunit
MAYKLAEKVMLPVMIAYDAFFLSHTTEIVDIPDEDPVDWFIPPYVPPVSLNFDDPRMFGGFFATDYFYEHRFTLQQASQEALQYYPEVCREFHRIFGRQYDLVETYRAEEAEVILVTAGAITSVSRIAIDALRDRGQRVGLMKLRLFRPVPVDCWRQVLQKAKKVAVIDRNLSPGLGGVFASEIRSALYALDNHPPVFSVVAGLGGRDVTPEDVEGILGHVLTHDKPSDAPLFWGLKQ